ncbi:basic secretory protein-like protein [Streptomyces sp. SP17BM10]|uniref:basic secretory protein-like protein n=1 Tax=Streptomyces sp. SP17BM10 TaxID=3002530 RepID=UPI002E792035|nr:basic secretory protein-like protein [Streptomyces sp. SP17BM10]MEE1788743.1 basic secretory protein-like protein [Streptomyces sp. SP17BM10]
MIIRRAAAAAVLSATVVSGMALGAQSASAAEPLPTSGADYRISSYAGGALQWDSTNTGGKVLIRDWNQSSAQQVWTVRDEGNGTWSIKVPGTNNAVDRDRTYNTVGSWNDVGAANQRWWLENTSTGNGRAWLLHSVSDGNLCLTRGADLGVRVAGCNAGDPAQSWNLDNNTGTTPPTAGRPAIDLDYSQAPDLGPWLEQQKRTVADYYPQISNLLTEGAFPAPTYFRIIMDPALKDHPAYATYANGANEVHVNIDYTRNNRGDTGFLVHEAVHVAVWNNPHGPDKEHWWVGEGLADWVRDYNFQPGTGAQHFGPNDHYDSGYQATARFIDYVSHAYDKPDLAYLVNMNPDDDGIWARLTGKGPDQLWNEMPK